MASDSERRFMADNKLLAYDGIFDATDPEEDELLDEVPEQALLLDDEDDEDETESKVFP